MKVRVGGKVVYDDTKPTLIGKLDEVTKQVEETVDKMNRKSRRNKLIKKVVGLFGVISTLAYSAVAHAEEVAPNITQTPIPEQGIPERIANVLADRLIEHVTGSMPHAGETASIYWKLNEIASKSVLTTQDFFQNPSLVGMYTVVSFTAMSVTSLIMGKKCLDMIKAHTVGGSTMGVSELILRCFASVLLTYLTLPIMSYGVKLSNVVVQTMMANFGSGMIPMGVHGVGSFATTFIGEFFWIIGFFLLMALLMIQYWVRQINLIVLGIFSPFATTSWIVDGGAMIGTLVQETIVHLTTPLVQGGVMAIGTAIVTSIAASQGVDPINAVFASIATMFVMLTVPSFLRKFVTGTINPFKWALNTAVGIKAMPARLLAVAK